MNGNNGVLATIFIYFVVLVGFSAMLSGKPQHNAPSEPVVRLIPIGDEHSFAVGVIVDSGEADQVIVEILYKTMIPGYPDLVRKSTSVVPAIGHGGAAMSDSVPVPKEKIFRVDITLVKNLTSRSYKPEELKE
jgi:hypothetical protein